MEGNWTNWFIPKATESESGTSTEGAAAERGSRGEAASSSSGGSVATSSPVAVARLAKEETLLLLARRLRAAEFFSPEAAKLQFTSSWVIRFSLRLT